MLRKNAGYTKSGTTFKLLWRSLKEDSFWKLVSELLFGRRESPHYRHIIAALRSTLGITLMYGGDKNLDPRGRNFHYFADVVGGLVVTDLEKNEVSFTVEPFKEVESRASVSYRDQILRILNANRMLDLRDCDAEALLCFDGLNHNHPIDLAYLALAERLSERLPQLSGESLRHLVALLQSPPSWLSQNRLSTPQRINKQGIATPRHAVRGDTGRAQASPNNRQCQIRGARPTRSGVKWMVRQFKNKTHYTNCDGDWHDRESEGYYVRKSKNPHNPKITVYADTEKITKLQVEFQPAKVEQLNNLGGPKGIKWTPNQASKPAFAVGEWRVKNYRDDDEIGPGPFLKKEQKYVQAGIEWHSSKLGFYVREDGDRISVFANVQEVKEPDLMRGFVKLPKEPFDPEGRLPGTAWTPPQ
jgi:hypothetical protein